MQMQSTGFFFAPILLRIAADLQPTLAANHKLPTGFALFLRPGLIAAAAN